MPPFTQLNTPYPATAYLKGFLGEQGVRSAQADLGIEVILSLFSAKGLHDLFDAIDRDERRQLSKNASRIIDLKDEYVRTIDHVIAFLQEKNPMLAHLICSGNYLPEAGRFEQIADLDWAFGSMGLRDKARHLATLYLEDISDLIVEAVDSHFGFSRYAERLGQSARTFDAIDAALKAGNTYVDDLCMEALHKLMDEHCPTLVALSVPFPGNLYSAFKCGQWIKRHWPEVKVCMGGGYPNTELRRLKDPRVFDYLDFITLDDGEAPLMHLLAFLEGKKDMEDLKRTFLARDGKVVYCNGSIYPDYKQKDVGTPDYEGLPLQSYLSVIEIANPMHRLWSDGRWNKLTLAHGCYWGKCTFCDISLDYIKVYEATTAKVLVDRMERLVVQTGQSGFHFVDEAAPPALMREVALEILRRGLTIVWWTNIRFEKSFTYDLCQLLAASGCIAVSGGLEVASDRLLGLIEKGVTVAQVAKVAANFTEAGIMVHAYLMYGFPSQTDQEVIDSLEIVRQLFLNGVVQSGFWHLFAMTAHSPVGSDPAKFQVKKAVLEEGTFANNDIPHVDPVGDHSRFNEGLRKSLFNYMHGLCFDFPLQKWFAFKVPRTDIKPWHIEQVLLEERKGLPKPSSKIYWLGGNPVLKKVRHKKKGQAFYKCQILVQGKAGKDLLNVTEDEGEWWEKWLKALSARNETTYTWSELAREYPGGEAAFNDFWNGELALGLRQAGLVVL